LGAFWYKQPMPLVDLRGREHDRDVRRLLDAEPPLMLVGWERDGGLVACAALERLSDEELAVDALAADDDTAADDLLDALAAVATAARLVAEPETEDDRARLVRCGFVPESAASGRRLVRTLSDARAGDDAVRAATLHDVEAAIRAAWGRDTSDDPDEWSPGNSARGQCAVTALLVRELLGGDILVAHVLRDGRRVERHAWNRLPSGLTLDLTREQFVRGEAFGPPAVEEVLSIERHPERYAALRERVLARLGLDAA
jgi:hypothetical protein